MEGELNSPIAEKTRGKKRARRRGPRLTGVSRQRRMANARERSRVQNLNAHIERLRDLIPLFPGEKKPSKTETIRLAAVYISCLTDILEEAAPEGLERISSEDLMPTFPGFEDSLTLAAGIPPSLSLPKFLFEPFCDEGRLIHLSYCIKDQFTSRDPFHVRSDYFNQSAFVIKLTAGGQDLSSQFFFIES